MLKNGVAQDLLLKAACGAAWLCGRPAAVERQLRVARAAGVITVPGDIKNGLLFLKDGEPCEVLSFDSKKIGKGVAKTSMKVRNLIKGSIQDANYNSGFKLEEAETTKVKCTFSYDMGDGNFVFMDSESYEEMFVPRDSLGEFADWVTDGMQAEVIMFDGRPLTAYLKEELIQTVTAVNENPGRTDATGQITLENGVVISGPSYLKPGEKVLISPRTFGFMKRVE